MRAYEYALLCIGLCLSGGSIAEIDRPKGVHIALENTYAVCDELLIYGVFSSSKKSEPKEDYQVVPDTCATAFQISENEILTAAHALPPLQVKLLMFLNNRRLMTEKHRFDHDRMMPHGDMCVVYKRVFYSSEGIVLETPTITFTVPWASKIATSEAIVRLAEHLDESRWEIDESRATIKQVTYDLDKDLALLKMEKPIPRDAYVVVGDYSNAEAERTWGIGARKPGRFGDGTPNLIVNPGFVSLVDAPQRSDIWELGEHIQLDMITSEYINWQGMSGGPNVDSNGILMGVTHMGLNTVILDLIPPCNKEMPHGRTFPCARWIVSPQDISEFLDSARK